MDRRDFIKTTGFGVAALAIPTISLCNEEDTVFNSALDEVIQKNVLVFDSSKTYRHFDDVSFNIIENVFKTNFNWSSPKITVTEIIVSKKVEIKLSNNILDRINIIRHEGITDYWLKKKALLASGSYVNYKHTEILLAATQDGIMLPFSL